MLECIFHDFTTALRVINLRHHCKQADKTKRIQTRRWNLTQQLERKYIFLCIGENKYRERTQKFFVYKQEYNFCNSVNLLKKTFKITEINDEEHILQC